MRKIVQIRSNEFVIFIGDDVWEKDQFTPNKFFNGVRNAFQRMEGVPDRETVELFSERMLEPVGYERNIHERKKNRF